MVCRNLTRKKAICTDRFSGLPICGTRSSNGLSIIKISQLNLCLKVHILGSCLSGLSAFDEVRGSVSEFSSPVACDVKGDVEPIDCATVALVCCAKKVREIIIESPVREVGDEKTFNKNRRWSSRSAFDRRHVQRAGSREGFGLYFQTICRFTIGSRMYV